MAKSTHVALLRAINVGGNHMIPMKRLVELFVDAGCTNVRSYIQSGNIVFTASDAVARRIPKAIAAAITATFGFAVPVVTRSAAELRAIARAHPLASAGDDNRLHVAFLAEQPTPTRVAAFAPPCTAGEQFVVRGRDIYVSFPGGTARTKLTVTYFDRALATTTTFRNWRTVGQLCAMVGD